MALNKTAISMLQELMVAKGQPMPNYSIKSVGNELEPKFSCCVETSLVTASAEARNKKDAKQLAAECALTKLGYKVYAHTFPKTSLSPDNVTAIKLPNAVQIMPTNFIDNKNYIGELHEFASRSGCGYPTYEWPLFEETGQFKFICKFQGLDTIGYASNKKQAKQIASYEMISKLKSGKVNIVALPQQTKKSILEPNECEMEVLKKLEQFSFVGKNIESSLPYSEGYPEIEKNISTIEKALEELRKFVEKYELKEVQSNPYIIEINLVDKNMTLMGSGPTKNEAMVNALNSTLAVLQEGCSLIDL